MEFKPDHIYVLGTSGTDYIDLSNRVFTAIIVSENNNAKRYVDHYQNETLYTVRALMLAGF